MSSKLMDVATVTHVVPWRLHAEDADHEAHRIHFGSVDGSGKEVAYPLDSPEDPEPRADASARHAQPEVADHSECERQSGSLEREVHRLNALIAEEKRAAYHQGFEAGAEQELAKWTDALSRCAKSVAELVAWKPRLRSQVEADAVRLSLAIARKVLRREVNVDPDAIAGLLRVAMDKVNARDVLRIRASPQDAADLGKRLSDFGLPVHVDIVEDSGLERGSLILDTNQGHVDASVETQLTEIERGLADALERNRHR